MGWNKNGLEWGWNRDGMGWDGDGIRMDTRAVLWHRAEVGGHGAAPGCWLGPAAVLQLHAGCAQSCSGAAAEHGAPPRVCPPPPHPAERPLHYSEKVLPIVHSLGTDSYLVVKKQLSMENMLVYLGREHRGGVAWGEVGWLWGGTWGGMRGCVGWDVGLCGVGFGAVWGEVRRL